MVRMLVALLAGRRVIFYLLADRDVRRRAAQFVALATNTSTIFAIGKMAPFRTKSAGDFQEFEANP